MAASELTGVNAAYVAQLLQDYVEAPGSVAPEWRALFEENGAAVAAVLPGLDALGVAGLGRSAARGGHRTGRTSRSPAAERREGASAARPSRRP